MCNVVQLFLAANAILLMRKWNHAFLLLAIALAWKWQITSLLVACVQTFPPPRKKSRFFLRERGGGRLYTGYASRRYSIKNKLGDRIIKQLLNSVIAKYRDLSVASRSIIRRNRGLKQIIDLRDTDMSRIAFAAKNSWTTLHMSTPLFVGTLNNAKPYFFWNEMNKKDLTF